jgi:hypothetical protein
MQNLLEKSLDGSLPPRNRGWFQPGDRRINMWDRDFASYDDLIDDKVLESHVQPQTIRSIANKAKNALPSGFPWCLSTDSVNRQLTKVPAAERS